jgi:N-acetylneuraminic acid mutarotase
MLLRNILTKVSKIGTTLSFMAAIAVAGCGGGGGGSGGNTSTASGYTVGGILSGLATGNSITITNGTDTSTLTANGSFTFPTKLSNGASYSLSIVTLPTNQPCTSTYGAGTVSGGNVSNVNLICGSQPSGSFVGAASLVTGRGWHTATLLPNGKTLVVGGTGNASANAELYDPVSNTWSATGNLITERRGHSATLLPNGKVLVVGGINFNGSVLSILASTELYDPATNTWSAEMSLPIAPGGSGHTATLLPNGKVLVLGKAGGVPGSAVAELYDPSAHTWSAAASPATPRYEHTATLLPNGKVLVAGGQDGDSAMLASAELYDPASNTWAAAGSLASVRGFHTATLLPNGKILVACGLDSSFAVMSSAELYDPASNTWSVAGSLTTARYAHTATLLPTGKVLVAGGSAAAAIGAWLASAELYEPLTNTWTATGNLAFAHQDATATLLQNGKLLIASGGNLSTGTTTNTELYW